MPNQVSSILRLHAAMTGGGGEDASCLGAGIVDIGVGTALAAKQAVKIEGDEVLDVDGAVGSPDHETTRSVPPYNFGGTLSARGATCAMRTSFPSRRIGTAFHFVINTIQNSFVGSCLCRQRVSSASQGQRPARKRVVTWFCRIPHISGML
jgi:hypothetical protein